MAIETQIDTSEGSKRESLPFKSTKQLTKYIDSFEALIPQHSEVTEDLLELLQDIRKIPPSIGRKSFEALVSHKKILKYLTDIIKLPATLQFSNE